MESSTTSKAVILKLKQQFSRHGIPNTVFSDNDPQFDSEFLREWEFGHVISISDYAQSRPFKGLSKELTKTTQTLGLTTETRPQKA